MSHHRRRGDFWEFWNSQKAECETTMMKLIIT